ncbi:MAG TPA: hypothetical protein PLB89_03990 [Flavobacteriales bacterium]|nr:hypothetical protein [Flavobacteriales bacterium]
MIIDTERPDTADHDQVMSWLQDRKMKDDKPRLARGPHAYLVDINTAIARVQEVAYQQFPNIDRSAFDLLVRLYIDPKERATEHLPQDPMR